MNVVVLFQGFFRRTVKERDMQKYECSRNGDCEITTATRNICKFCRYQKCLDVGMKPDGECPLHPTHPRFVPSILPLCPRSKTR